MEESKIKSIKLILAVLALGLVATAGIALAQEYDGQYYDEAATYGSDGHGWGDNHRWDDGRSHKPDFGPGKFYDWLNPGGYYYTYYPSYAYTYYPASYYYYPAYYQTYTPVYTYTAPAPVATVTPPVVYSYDPVVSDPWWAVNVYGLGSTTYYYSSSWSWSYYHGGLFFR